MAKARRMRRGDEKRAVAYLRASTEDQRLSPEAQRAACEAWAARAGATIVAWHVDQGVSGGAELDARPGLLAALGGLRELDAGALLVARRDRLARDVGVALAIERAASQAGATVVSADGVANGEGPAEELLRTMLDGFAAYERAVIRARTKAALGAKKARGERVGECPWGYRAGDDGRLVPDEREQAALALAQRLRAEGASLRAVTRELELAGVVGRTGRPLHLTSVARMLASVPTPNGVCTRTPASQSALQWSAREPAEGRVGC